MKPKGTAHATLRKFQKSREKYIYISAPIIRNPLAFEYDQQGRHFPGPQFIVAAGNTYRKVQ